MKEIKFYEKVLIVFFTFFLIVIAIWLTVIPLTKSKSFYISEYEKHDTYNNTGYSKEELGLITDKIIDFLFGRTEDMQVEINDEIVFSNQALIHMRDVRDLFTLGQVLGWIVLGLWIMIGIYLYCNFHRIKKSLLKYSIRTIIFLGCLLVIIGIIIVIDFDFAFKAFHKIIFPNPTKFNDAFFGTISNYEEVAGVNNKMLITILSEGLFMDVAIYIGLGVVIILGIWFTGLIFINKSSKKSNVIIKES
jgi:integral membrane protein (TIGR01906 family)